MRLKKRRKESNSNPNASGRIGASIDLAVQYLQQGRIVAFPTETYYGLAVDPTNPIAVDRLYQLKQRPVNKPLLLLVSELESLQNIISGIPGAFKPLIAKHWPGPLTLIFPASDEVNPVVTAGTETVGIRISPHPVASKFVSAFGNAITATSANVSGMNPARTAAEVKEMFGEKIDYILDGGATPAGLCSTIVGIENSGLIVIRQGEIDISSSSASV